jgi:hypothetical protein
MTETLYLYSVLTFSRTGKASKAYLLQMKEELPLLTLPTDTLFCQVNVEPWRVTISNETALHEKQMITKLTGKQYTILTAEEVIDLGIEL